MKSPSPEQKARAAARREQFKAIWKQVAAMPEAERLALVAKCGIVNVDGRPLSCYNMCLVAMQKADATVIGGFRQWLKAGRVVKKGERGCMIWVPLRGKGQEPAPAEPDADEADAKPKRRMRFIPGTIFDISQTMERTENDTPEPVEAEAEVEPATPEPSTPVPYNQTADDLGLL